MLVVYQFHLASALFMTGLIWFVQLVHYPLFSSVPADSFPAYERLHARRTTWIVAPVMLLELATGVLLVVIRLPHLGLATAWVNLGLLALIWFSTAVWQVPLHSALAKRFSSAAHRGLVSGNWIRTGAWSLRSVLLLYAAASPPF